MGKQDVPRSLHDLEKILPSNRDTSSAPPQRVSKALPADTDSWLGYRTPSYKFTNYNGGCTNRNQFPGVESTHLTMMIRIVFPCHRFLCCASVGSTLVTRFIRSRVPSTGLVCTED